jgi:selenide,water dikinase
LGIGVLATALKRQKINPKDYQHLVEVTCQLNKIGEVLGNHEEVHALTDVTGFGLLGHALEMAEGANLSLQLDFKSLPLIEGVQDYMQQFVFPDNTYRNWNAYSPKVIGVKGMELVPLCDPQTSGGLLISVAAEDKAWFVDTMLLHEQLFWEVGVFILPQSDWRIAVVNED